MMPSKARSTPNLTHRGLNIDDYLFAIFKLNREYITATHAINIFRS